MRKTSWVLGTLLAVTCLPSLTLGIWAANSGDNLSREKRLLSSFGFGGRKNRNAQVAEVKMKVEVLLDQISELEKNRAKSSTIKKLWKAIEQLSDVCPPNTSSLRVKDKCFEHVTNLWLDYDSAVIYCSGRGGRLALPDVKDENYLKELRETFPGLGDNSVLVGITDILQEGRFYFSDGIPAPPEKFLGKQYPLNPKKDCVSLTLFQDSSLVDTDCKKLHEALCEYDPVNLLTFLNEY